MIPKTSKIVWAKVEGIPWLTPIVTPRRHLKPKPKTPPRREQLNLLDLL